MSKRLEEKGKGFCFRPCSTFGDAWERIVSPFTRPLLTRWRLRAVRVTTHVLRKFVDHSVAGKSPLSLSILSLAVQLLMLLDMTQ
jgi:hypothetical protein